MKGVGINFFVPAMAAAVIGHLLILQGFLLVVPSKHFRSATGATFLGSILDSSQMERVPFFNRSAEAERVSFLHDVPPRSEQEYFQDLKDFIKPEAGAAGQKRDVKSLFPVRSRLPAENIKSRWQAGDIVDYQPLQLP